MKNHRHLLPTTLLLATLAHPFVVGAQGMPAEARANIHALFDGHATITRTVEVTKTGYIAVTESSDPEVATALRGHVNQMSKRLESGLMVRRWDPAFAEYVEFYAQIEHEFTPTDRGLKATVTGKTPDAIRVARNHAQVISEFVADGWVGHDRSHPAVAVQDTTSQRGMGNGRGMGQGRGMMGHGKGPGAGASAEPRAEAGGCCQACRTAAATTEAGGEPNSEAGACAACGRATRSE